MALEPGQLGYVMASARLIGWALGQQSEARFREGGEGQAGGDGGLGGAPFALAVAVRTGSGGGRLDATVGDSGHDGPGPAHMLKQRPAFVGAHASDGLPLRVRDVVARHGDCGRDSRECGSQPGVKREQPARGPERGSRDADGLEGDASVAGRGHRRLIHGHGALAVGESREVQPASLMQEIAGGRQLFCLDRLPQPVGDVRAGVTLKACARDSETARNGPLGLAGDEREVNRTALGVAADRARVHVNVTGFKAPAEAREGRTQR